jgi:hypothetical protein
MRVISSIAYVLFCSLYLVYVLLWRQLFMCFLARVCNGYHFDTMHRAISVFTFASLWLSLKRVTNGGQLKRFKKDCEYVARLFDSHTRTHTQNDPNVYACWASAKNKQKHNSL